jgi:histidinol-phosphate aminotransferase
LRDVISKKFNINSERIICGAGSDQIFDLICQIFIEPGDEVIVTEYGFIMHRIYASLYRAKVLLAKEKKFKASVDEILKKVTNKTKIVFVANPNNPTGTYLTRAEMLNLRQKLRSNILLVVDDAYFEFLNKDDFTSGLDLFKEEENVLITRTFSKIYGLAGLRLGWGYASKKIIDVMYQIKPPFNVNRAALCSGIEAIKDNEWTKKAINYNTLWSKKIFSVLKECKIQTNEPTANFFLMNFNATKINSEEVFQKLVNNRLLLRKMIQYKLPNALRLTIGDTKSNELFIKSIRGIFK